MKNLELKFKCRDFKLPYKAIKEICAVFNGVLYQNDIYFNFKPGRLKLRTINNKINQLIFYKRSNRKSSKISNYYIEKIKHPHNVLSILRAIYGIKTIVIKNRILFIYKNTRIHLDSVRGIGKFIEFEIVCKNPKDELNAPAIMKMLKSKFKVSSENIIKYSYSDLMIRKKGE